LNFSDRYLFSRDFIENPWHIASPFTPEQRLSEAIASMVDLCTRSSVHELEK